MVLLSGTLKPPVRRDDRLVEGGFVAAARRLQCRQDFFVAGLGEISIPETNGAKVLRHRQGHDTIGEFFESCHRVLCSDRYRQDDLFRLSGAGGQDGRPRRVPGRQAIVDHNRHTAFQIYLWAPLSISLDPPSELNSLPVLDGGQMLVLNSQIADQIIVQHPYTMLGDCSDTQFGTSGGAELANDDDVERAGQVGCNRDANNNAASGEAKNNRLSISVLTEPVAELRSCVGAIVEHGGVSIPRLPTCGKPAFSNRES